MVDEREKTRGSDRDAARDASGGPADRAADMPAAGPHAKPELIEEDATPGSGTLPSVGDGEGDVEPGSG